MAQVASYLLMDSAGFHQEQQNMRGVGWDYGGKSMTQCYYDFYIIYCPHLILPFKTCCIKLFFFFKLYELKRNKEVEVICLYICAVLMC